MKKILPLITILVLIGLSVILLDTTSYLIVKQKSLTDIKCNQINYNDQKILNRENLKKILFKLDIEEERKWKKNNISDKIKSLQNKWNFYAYEKKNRRVKAKLYLYIDDKLICFYNAKLRAHGDLGDHRRGTDLPSLNIHLTDGNLFGITKFILFRPHTRKYESEVFGANLLRELKYLSPRTMMVDVIYNQKKSKFIFQEKIVKEFIEELNFIENPLYEADERFVFIELSNGRDFLPNEYRKLQKSKLINKKIILNDTSHLRNSILGLSILNEFLIKYESELIPYWILDLYSINKKIDKNKNYFKKLPSFDSLLYVLNGTHGLASDDRRFYFDPINEIFYPVYYDGDFEIFDRNNLFSEKFTYGIKNNQIDKITPSIFIGANEAFNKVKKLDIDEFYKKLQLYGSELTKKDIKKALEIIIFRLKSLKDLDQNSIAEVNLKSDTRDLNDPEFKSNLKRKIIFNTEDKNEYLICDIYGIECKKIALDLNQISKLLSQELKIDNFDVVYTGKKFSNSSLNGWERNNLENRKKIKITDNDINFYIYGDINYKFSEDEKKIFFEKNSIDGRIVFKDLPISNLDIYFSDNSKIVKNRNFLKNLNGLTGCLNFIDSKLQNVNIFVENSKCEDALNIIRSEGILDKVVISNSISDGLDMDFSKFNIKNLKSTNSKNDCADFSYGSYQIQNISVSDCGDKGISVGENSIFKNKFLKVNKSKVGLASKDSSKTILQNVLIENSDKCVSAYNKKQEFAGGYINIINFKCKNYLKFKELDNVSQILINEKI